MLAEDIHLLTEFMSNRNWRPATVFHKLNGVQLFLKTITLIADWPAYTGKYVWCLHDKLNAGSFLCVKVMKHYTHYPSQTKLAIILETQL